MNLVLLHMILILSTVAGSSGAEEIAPPRPAKPGCLGVESGREIPRRTGAYTMEVDLGTFVFRTEDTVSPEDAEYLVDLVQTLAPHMIEILGSPVSLDTLTFGFHDSGGVYYCGPNLIRMSSLSPARNFDNDEDGAIDEDPYDGLDNDGDGAIDEDLAYSPGWDEIFIHELSHAFQDDLLCRGAFPSWFTEGMAHASTYLVGKRMEDLLERRSRSAAFAREMASDETRDLLGAPIIGGPQRLIDRVVYWRYAYASAQATLLIPALAEISSGRDRPMARLTDALREELLTSWQSLFRVVDRTFQTPVDGVLPPSRWMQNRAVVCPSFGDGVFLGITTPDVPVNPERLGLYYFARTGYGVEFQPYLSRPLFTGVHGERTRAGQLNWVPTLSPGAYRVDQREPRNDGSTISGTTWILEVHPEILDDDGLWNGVAAVFVDGSGNPVDPPGLEVTGTVIERVPGGLIVEPFPGTGAVSFEIGNCLLATVTALHELPRFAVIPVEETPSRGVVTWTPYNPSPGGMVTATLKRSKSALGSDPVAFPPLLSDPFTGQQQAESYWTERDDLVHARFVVPEDFEVGYFSFQSADGTQHRSPPGGVLVRAEGVVSLLSARVLNGSLNMVFDGAADPVSLVIDLAETAEGPWTPSPEPVQPDPLNNETVFWSIPPDAAGHHARVRWTPTAGDRILATLFLGTPPAVERHVAYAPFPNPSDIGSLWRVDLASPLDADFEVLDVSGRVVHGPEHLSLYAGRNQFWWDGRLRGTRVPAGIYFLRLTGSGIDLRSKIVIMSN